MKVRHFLIYLLCLFFIRAGFTADNTDSNKLNYVYADDISRILVDISIIVNNLRKTQHESEEIRDFLKLILNKLACNILSPLCIHELLYLPFPSIENIDSRELFLYSKLIGIHEVLQNTYSSFFNNSLKNNLNYSKELRGEFILATLMKSMNILDFNPKSIYYVKKLNLYNSKNNMNSNEKSESIEKPVNIEIENLVDITPLDKYAIKDFRKKKRSLSKEERAQLKGDLYKITIPDYMRFSSK